LIPRLFVHLFSTQYHRNESSQPAHPCTHNHASNPHRTRLHTHTPGNLMNIIIWNHHSLLQLYRLRKRKSLAPLPINPRRKLPSTPPAEFRLRKPAHPKRPTIMQLRTTDTGRSKVGKPPVTPIPAGKQYCKNPTLSRLLLASPGPRSTRT